MVLNPSELDVAVTYTLYSTPSEYEQLPVPESMSRGSVTGWVNDFVHIEIAPLAFMRGRTLTRAFVILDEAQNTTPQQMKMFLTRLGEDSRMAITGDPSQVDLPRGIQSGLKEATGILEGVKGVEIVAFTERDVVRHPLVARIVAAYDKHERSEKK